MVLGNGMDGGGGSDEHNAPQGSANGGALGSFTGYGTQQQAWYKSAKNFYEKDRVLEPADREWLGQTYQSVAKAHLWGRLVGFAAGCGADFAYQAIRLRSRQGVNLSRSFLFGVAGTVVGTYQCGLYAYWRALESVAPVERYDDLEEDAGAAARRRRHEVLQLLRDSMPAVWADYFNKTARDPSLRMPDPQVLWESILRGERPNMAMYRQEPLAQSPMARLASPPDLRPVQNPVSAAPNEATTNLPVNEDPFSAEITEPSTSLSAWDRVRQQNSITSSPGDSWEQVRKRSIGAFGGPGPQNADKEQNEFDELLNAERRGIWDEIDGPK
ncbi:AaceriACL038Cp [[Ashbya] aceris (nom. inval.)]|nr:AaceriACL038Cp [[Ashbya] aceris (nom. inval.)]